MNIILKPPTDLSIHPIAKLLPEWSSDAAKFDLFIDDIAERGIDHPVLIDGQDRIIDGRHRWLASKRLKLDGIPCLVKPDAEVASVIIGTLAARRHCTKGAIAYLSYPLFLPALDEVKKRQIGNLRKGTASPTGYPIPSREIPKKSEDFAASLGVSPELFKHAARVHEIFAESPEYKSEMEPRILDVDCPVGLGAVIAGYAGRNATRGESKAVRPALAHVCKTFTDLHRRVDFWVQLQPPERAEVKKSWRGTLRQLPADLVSLLAGEAAAEKRARGKAGKPAKQPAKKPIVS